MYEHPLGSGNWQPVPRPEKWERDQAASLREALYDAVGRVPGLLPGKRALIESAIDHVLRSATLAALAVPVGVHCGNCGADLSAYPTTAAGHACALGAVPPQETPAGLPQLRPGNEHGLTYHAGWNDAVRAMHAALRGSGAEPERITDPYAGHDGSDTPVSGFGMTPGAMPECVADGSHSDDLSHAAELRERKGRHAR